MFNEFWCSCSKTYLNPKNSEKCHSSARITEEAPMICAYYMIWSRNFDFNVYRNARLPRSALGVAPQSDVIPGGPYIIERF